METGWAAAAGASALVLRDRTFGGFEASHDTVTTLVIDGADGHHLQRVRRLAVDEIVVIADGAGEWYLSRITALGDGTLTVTQPAPFSPSPGRTRASALRLRRRSAITGQTWFAISSNSASIG